ncbi:MAG TPA: YjgP/YjgQ family permease [Arcobacter sp.]|nr:YjgP/YjgQ family permease [Arcobacter sp.]
MKLITKYLLTKYLKYFFIILFSLEIFFVGFDLLQFNEKLPSSANLQLLFLMYDGFFILTIALPLSILFAWIVTLSFLIRDNTLVSFYALGASKKQVILPILFLAFILSSILIALQSTPLAYSYEQRNKILKDKFFVNEKSNILLTYNNNFIYFEKLYPFEKKAVNVKIFEKQNDQLVKVIMAKKAYYQNEKWYVLDAKIITKPEKIYWEDSKLTVTYEKFLYTLEGFKPEIINNVYQTKVEYSISDALYTIFLFDEQGLKTDKIRGMLYSKLFIPFFVLPMLLLIFMFSGISGRFFKMGSFISLGILSSLGAWGIVIALQKITIANVVLPEIGLLTPLVIFIMISIYLYNKRVV